MKVLTQYEVECVNGGSWDSFWQAVGKFLGSLFGSNGLDAAVTTCTTNGGTANFTVNGGSYTVTTGAGVAVPVEGEVIPIQLQASGSQVAQSYSVTCTGAGGGNHGGAGRSISSSTN